MKQFGSARFVYNYYLDKRKTAYFETGKTFGYIDCTKDLTLLKQSKGLEWLQEASAQVLQQSLQDLDNAYKRFFAMCKSGTLPPIGKQPRKDGMPKGYPTLGLNVMTNLSGILKISRLNIIKSIYPK